MLAHPLRIARRVQQQQADLGVVEAQLEQGVIELAERCQRPVMGAAGAQICRVDGGGLARRVHGDAGDALPRIDVDGDVAVALVGSCGALAALGPELR